MGKFNVLIVDDEELISEELSELISYLGCNSHTANNAFDAISYLKKNNEVDLIITDIKMPIKSGIDFIEEVNSMKKKKYKIAVISGDNGDEFNEASIMKKFSNVVVVLNKPIGLNDILLVLSYIPGYKPGNTLQLDPHS